MKFRRFVSIVAVVLSAATLYGCASARMQDTKVDNAFREQRYDDAAARLKVGYAKQGEYGRDSLLYVLDLGLALHSAGKFDESNKYFLQAYDLAVIKDYTSISREGATLLLSDNIKEYKAEDFENVLIDTYLAMNYAVLGNFDDALVEARRTNQKLYMMVSEGGRKYQQDPFTKYLSAVLYETGGEFNNSYVDYRAVHDLVPSFPGLGRDLWRAAELVGNDDDMEKWDEEYKLTQADHQAAMLAAPNSPMGEVIVLYENGISPIKKPDPQWEEIPKFFPRYNPVTYANVEVNGQVLGSTAMLTNIEEVAIENLKEKWGGLLAKKLAGLVAKGAVGYGVAKLTNNVALGELAAWALVQADKADCRSWELLPHDLQVARFALPPGTYKIRILPVGGAPAPMKTITIAKGKKVFVNFRYMP